MAAEVTQFGFLDMQVCVPEDYTDDQVIAFAEGEYPCGTTEGWQIRRQHEGYSERVPREGRDRDNHVHIMLDA